MSRERIANVEKMSECTALLVLRLCAVRVCLIRRGICVGNTGPVLENVVDNRRKVWLFSEALRFY